MQEDDPYEILGIKYDENENGIRKAYRKLALLYHPDKVGRGKCNTEMQTKMAKINTAYSILGDQERKREYDYIHSTANRRYKSQREEPFPSYFPKQSKTAKYFSSRHLNQPLPPIHQPSQTEERPNELFKRPIQFRKNRDGTTRIIKKTTRYENGKKLTFREIATVYPDGRTEFKRERLKQNENTRTRKKESKNYISEVLFCFEGAFDTVQEFILTSKK